MMDWGTEWIDDPEKNGETIEVKKPNPHPRDQH
jgi:hypothetical protein